MKYFCLSIISIIFSNCDKEIVPRFHKIEEKLNVTANFNFINGITIKIDKALPSTTTAILNEEIRVNDARVFLIDSTSNTSWLIPFDTTISLYIKPDLKPITQTKYKISIDWHDRIYNSIYIATPGIPSFQIKNREISKASFYGNSGYQMKYTILLDSSSISHIYSSGAVLKTERFDRKFEFVDYIQKEDLCGYQFGLLPGRCLGDKNSDLSIVGYIMNDAVVNGSKDLVFKGRHYIYVSSVSPNFYSYRLAIKEPEPFEKYFLTPAPYPSDFQDAFGTFLISNMILIDSINIQ